MFDYQQIFDRRGELYNRATRSCPHARATERRLLLERLDLYDGCVVCDAPAGGGYVADGIAAHARTRTRVVCVEPSAAFAAMIPPRFAVVVSPLHDIALPERSVDRVASLAGLHHLESKASFFREAARILRPGGILAVADVLDGTPPARFLNGPVDRLCETGHDGDFLAPGEASALLADAGFEDVEEQHCRYTWDFDDVDAMQHYCRDLFGLTRAGAGEVLSELRRGLDVVESPVGARLSWSLVYAVGRLNNR